MISPNPVLTEAIDRLCRHEDLPVEQSAACLAEIMAGDVSPEQTAALLIALRTKGETVDELAGLAQTMRALATPVRVGRGDLVDTCGTGGGFATFNVSTTAGLVAAGAGCAVAKHGNRSATSKSGSADVLEALGVAIDLTPEQVAECIDQIGFGFIFAPAHHGATRHVVPVRKALGVRTAFNFLGPLTNPAGATRQVIGVADAAFQEVIARTAAALGIERALVASSADGLDELSASAETRVYEVAGDRLDVYDVAPEDVGVTRVDREALQGGTPAENAATTQAVLDGRPGPAREVTVLNAGAAVYVAGRAASLADGVTAAQEAIDDGRARAVLDQLVERTTAGRPGTLA